MTVHLGSPGVTVKDRGCQGVAHTPTHSDLSDPSRDLDRLSSKTEANRGRESGCKHPPRTPSTGLSWYFRPLWEGPRWWSGRRSRRKSYFYTPLDGKVTSLASVPSPPPPPQPYLKPIASVLLPCISPQAAPTPSFPLPTHHPHTHMPPAPKSPQAKRAGAPKAKGAVRAKSGCYTCRIRRKVRRSPVPVPISIHSPTQQKCDEQMTPEGSCQTCVRLRLQCLGFGAKRPDWLRVPIHSTTLFTHSLFSRRVVLWLISERRSRPSLPRRA